MTAIQVWTLIVAGMAVVATVTAAVLLRRTGKGTVGAAEKAAEASKKSADISEISAAASARSAVAAERGVEVNETTAAGVAARAHAAAFAQRYQDAASQLGHDKAAVRLAGVYAMAQLADDWDAQRQTCIDVLCAYLRMPWPLAGPSETATLEEEQVRSTITKVISEHLRSDAQNTWSRHSFDFSDSVLRDFKLQSVKLAGHIRMSNVRFEGECAVALNQSPKSIFLDGCTVAGKLELHEFDSSDCFDLNKVTVLVGSVLSVTCSPLVKHMHVSLSQVDGWASFHLAANAESKPDGSLSLIATVGRMGLLTVVTAPQLLENNQNAHPSDFGHLGANVHVDGGKVTVRHWGRNEHKFDWTVDVSDGGSVREQRPRKGGIVDVAVYEAASEGHKGEPGKSAGRFRRTGRN